MKNDDFYKQVSVWLATKPAPNVKWNLTQVDADCSKVTLTCNVEIDKYQFAITGSMLCPNKEEAIESDVKELYDGLPLHIEELLKQYARK